jgi:hypothetical protein
MAVTFTATLKADGGMFFEVPPEIMAALDGGKRPAVQVVINGVRLRTTIAVYGGRSYIGVRREIRDAAKVNLGDQVELSVEVDAQPRTVELPEDLAVALAADPEANRIFEGLSFTNRKEYADWILAAKRRETREQRVAEAPGLLKRGRRTPLQRNL